MILFLLPIIYIFLWIVAIFIVPLRLILLHPVLVIKYAITDVFKFFWYKKWRNFKMGKFNCYDAGSLSVFGSGKTLSGVHRIRKDYIRYQNKVIYDFQRREWVVQKVHLITNLTLKELPFEKMNNLGQIVSAAHRFRQYDIENGTLTCSLVLLDEAQNQLHCRSFKNNISPMMLKTLTECRHYNMSAYYDAPRFNQVDALLRQCTNYVIKNTKVWRFQCQKMYDANDLDNANNPTLIKPFWHSGFFIEDDLFNQYDTHEIIENLIKAQDENDLLSDEEILALQCNTPVDIDAVQHLSGKARKRYQHHKKTG